MQTPADRNINDTVRLLSPDLLRLGRNVQIMDYAVIGVPNEYRDGFEQDSDHCVRIGDGTTLYPHTVIYEGATLGAEVVYHKH